MCCPSLIGLPLTRSGINILFTEASFVDTTVFQSAATELLIIMDDLTQSVGGDLPAPGTIPLIVDPDTRVLAIAATESADGTVSIQNVDSEGIIAAQVSAGSGFTYYQVS